MTNEQTTRHLDALFGQRHGVAVLAFGRGPFRDDQGAYTHREWGEVSYEWPAEADRLRADVARDLATGDAVDVYVCPHLRAPGTTRRRRWGAVDPTVLHADWDSDMELPKWVTGLSPMRVWSGQPGHCHVYVLLEHGVDIDVWDRLQRAFVQRLGEHADPKIADNDLLRLGGTVNHKHDGGLPVVVDDSRPRRHTPADLARAIGVNLAKPRPRGQRLGDLPPVETGPVPDRLPRAVTKALAHPDRGEGARSEAHHRVVGACFDAGLSRAVTHAVLASYGPAVEKYRDRLADMTDASWLKVSAASDARADATRVWLAGRGEILDDAETLDERLNEAAADGQCTAIQTSTAKSMEAVTDEGPAEAVAAVGRLVWLATQGHTGADLGVLALRNTIGDEAVADDVIGRGLGLYGTAKAVADLGGEAPRACRCRGAGAVRRARRDPESAAAARADTPRGEATRETPGRPWAELAAPIDLEHLTDVEAMVVADALADVPPVLAATAWARLGDAYRGLVAPPGPVSSGTVVPGRDGMALPPWVDPSSDRVRQSLAQYTLDVRGNGERLIALFGDHIARVPDLAVTRAWTGSVWAEQSDETIYHLAERMTDAMLVEALALHSVATLRVREGGSRELSQVAGQAETNGPPYTEEQRHARAILRRGTWAANYRTFAVKSRSGQRLTLASAESHPGASAPAGRWDAHPTLLSVATGVIELLPDGGHSVREHRASDLLTRISPARYDPADRSTPLWTEYLEWAQPDPAVRRYLRALVGITLLGDNRLHLFPMLIGKSRSGKSVFLKVLLGLLGDDVDGPGYAASFTLDMMRSRAGEGPNAALFRSLPRRALICTEGADGPPLSAEQIKRFVSTDPSSARDTFAKARSISDRVPAFTPWLGINRAPDIGGADEALMERVAPVPFEQYREADERDIALPEKIIAAELSGLLNWALDGYADAMTHPEVLYRPPAVCVAAKADFWDVVEPTQRWRSEHTKSSDKSDEWITVDESWRQASRWFDETRIKADQIPNKADFGSKLAEMGFPSVTVRRRDSQGRSTTVRVRRGLAWDRGDGAKGKVNPSSAASVTELADRLRAVE